MSKVISIHEKRGEPPAGELNRSEALQILTQLVYDDSEAFFTLEAASLSCAPINMGKRVAKVLRKLRLIDKVGYPTTHVRIACVRIAGNMGEELIKEAITCRESCIS